MGNLHLVTGYGGKAHITAEDHGSFNAALLGSGNYVLDRGSKFSASHVSSNTVRIHDGDLLLQGRHVTGEESTDTPGTETKPEEDYKLPPFDEQTESIPDTFEFDDNMWYIAYKNTTTYSLVRSKNAMVVVKAKLLEIQETFFKPVRSFSHRADRFG